MQFNELLLNLPQYNKNSNKSASTGLFIYLNKLRTGRANPDIANELHLSVSSVVRHLKKAREALMAEFTYKHVNKLLSRDELIEHNTTMCQKLFYEKECPRAMIICDGTYIYTNKSTNYQFQKFTYTDQKKRNFIKVMMCVASDGLIVYALGPYAAVDNDAKIMRAIFDTTDAFKNYLPGDVIMLDRGFRDCVGFIKEKGFDVKMPSLVQKTENKKQLSTHEANESRLTTATRFIVETRNGHMKTIWKIFDKDWNPQAVPHLMEDFLIGAALINKFRATFEPNQSNAVEIAETMLTRYEVENRLSKVVRTVNFERCFKSFEPFENIDALPILTPMDLVLIALGKYQIKQAASYCQEQMRESQFHLFRLPESKHELLADFDSADKELILLLCQIKSRHRGRKMYDAFVLIDMKSEGRNAVLEYCCECYVGLRTVGCCSHVMTIIWYSLYIRNRTMYKPAHFLDNFFENIPEIDGNVEIE